MPVRKQDIEYYGSAVMPDDDTVTDIGGAIDRSVRIAFSDMTTTGNIQVVSSDATDTTQTITVDAINSAGVVISEAANLNGITPVAMATNTDWRDLLKAVKSASTAGTVAVESVTSVTTGTAQGGAVDSITLDAADTAVDDFYRNKVLRITSGTGTGQIARIVAYDATTKVATPSRDFAVAPDATSVYVISDGIVFEKAPTEVLQVRRMFYMAAADDNNGVDKTYVEKIFAANIHASLTLTSATIAEVQDLSGFVDFALESVLDGTDTNGVGNNRLVPPAGYTFDSATKNVANSQNLSAGSAQGIWGQLSLVAGTPAQEFDWIIRTSGQTVA